MTILLTGGAGFIGANFIYYELNVCMTATRRTWPAAMPTAA